MIASPVHSQFLLPTRNAFASRYTVVGTLVTFWPTMLRTKMVDKALTHSSARPVPDVRRSGVDPAGAIFGMCPRRRGPGRLPARLPIVACTLRTSAPPSADERRHGLPLADWRMTTAYLVATTRSRRDMRAVTPIFVVFCRRCRWVRELKQRMGAATKEFSRWSRDRYAHYLALPSSIGQPGDGVAGQGRWRWWHSFLMVRGEGFGKHPQGLRSAPAVQPSLTGETSASSITPP